jgi:hypothetical protein
LDLFSTDISHFYIEKNEKNLTKNTTIISENIDLDTDEGKGETADMVLSLEYFYGPLEDSYLISAIDMVSSIYSNMETLINPSNAKNDPLNAKNDPSNAKNDPLNAKNDPSNAKNDPSNAKNDTGISHPSKLIPPAGLISGVYKKDDDHLIEVCCSIRVSMFIYICIYMYTYKICRYMRVYINSYTYILIHTFIHIHVTVCLYIFECVYVYSYIYIRIYIYIQI